MGVATASTDRSIAAETAIGSGVQRQGRRRQCRACGRRDQLRETAKGGAARIARANAIAADTDGAKVGTAEVGRRDSCVACKIGYSLERPSKAAAAGPGEAVAADAVRVAEQRTGDCEAAVAGADLRETAQSVAAQTAGSALPEAAHGHVDGCDCAADQRAIGIIVNSGVQAGSPAEAVASGPRDRAASALPAGADRRLTGQGQQRAFLHGDGLDKAALSVTAVEPVPAGAVRRQGQVVDREMGSIVRFDMGIACGCVAAVPGG